MPHNVEVPRFCSDLSNGPKEITLWVHEGEGPEGTVGRFVVLRQQPLLELPEEELEVGDVAPSDELEVALVVRELQRRAHDKAHDRVAYGRVVPGSIRNEVHLLVVEELAEGVHRGDGNVDAEVELEERDRVRPVIQG